MAKIFVEAYGCSASFSDSEMISGLVLNGGHTLVESSSESDLNVIVTCSVKDATANKMIHRIKSLNQKPLVVAGCLPKAEKSTVEKFSENAVSSKNLRKLNYFLKFCRDDLPKLKKSSIIQFKSIGVQ